MRPALIIFLALALAAVVSGASGVALLAGLGWTLVFVAVCLAVAAVVVIRGAADRG